jgi:hypothetical protein
MDHSAVTGACATCHNGSTATGKPGSHISTSSGCESCHNSNSWSSVRFDHNAVSGSCASCHNGSTATGKPGGHIATTAGCESCHNSSSWSSVRFDHNAVSGTCGSCHASDFKSDKHKKVDTPTQYYTASELNDCAGSCHIYKDSSLSIIEERKSSKHRAGDSDF